MGWGKDDRHLFAYFFIFFLGLASGSFLNVVIYRYQAGQSVIWPRSRCPHCSTFLQAGDLFPLLSFLLLKGRCRYCATKISPRYPLVELTSGLLYFACFYYFNFHILLCKYLVLFSLLLVISCIDLERQLIPNRFVLLLFVWILIGQFFFPEISPWSALSGFLLGGGFFYLIALLSKGGMGGGDIKLMAALGFAAGWPTVLIILFLAFILGALAGIFLLIFKEKTRKAPLAFAPFLALAFLLTTFWGRQIWQWYISFL